MSDIRNNTVNNAHESGILSFDQAVIFQGYPSLKLYILFSEQSFNIVIVQTLRSNGSHTPVSIARLHLGLHITV